MKVHKDNQGGINKITNNLTVRNAFKKRRL